MKNGAVVGFYYSFLFLVMLSRVQYSMFVFSTVFFQTITHIMI